MNELIKEKAPGKVIITGEHAVIYGAPALSMQIMRYAYCSIQKGEGIKIVFKNTSTPELISSFEEIVPIKIALDKRYQAFLKGEITASQILKDPRELLLYAISLFASENNIKIRGILIQISSEIPLRAGFGSSAAIIVSLLKALARFFDITFLENTLFKMAQKVEHLQHGKSSGLDVATVLSQMPIYFEKGHYQTIDIKTNALHLIHTGPSSSTTGECVSHVKPHFLNTPLVQKFKTVTNQITDTLKSGEIQPLISAIKDNHQLLKKLGLVPKTVGNFIQEIEERGGAAKICGAGSIFEGGAGCVLIVSEASFEDLINKYHYQLI
ncbi:mevalonate kinase [Chlamydiales bacterium]|nr:mevalonate kinase [Chlamydiales bacterium]